VTPELAQAIRELEYALTLTQDNQKGNFYLEPNLEVFQRAKQVVEVAKKETQ